MQENSFKKMLLSLAFLKTQNVETKENAFERVRILLLSTKNREDLVNSVKLINHFNKTYNINSESAEFIYFTKMVNLMKLIVRKKNKKSGDKNDESQRKCEIGLEKY